MIPLIIFMLVLFGYQFYAGFEVYRKLEQKGPKVMLRVFRTELTVILLIVLPLIIGNQLFREADLVSPEKKVEYGKRYDQPHVTYKGYLEHFEQDTTNLKYAFELVKAANEYFDRYAMSFNDQMRVYNKVYAAFERMSKSSDPNARDIGFFGMGFYSNHANDLETNNQNLYSVKDTNMLYFNYAMGMGYARTGRFAEAERHFLREVVLNGAVHDSYDYLAVLYDYTLESEKLRGLAYDPASRIHIPVNLAHEVFFAEVDLIPYVETIWLRVKRSFSIYGTVASLLVTLIWFFFLLMLNRFKRVALMPLLVCFVLGFLLSNGVYFLSDFLHLAFGLEFDGSFWGDLWYCILGIGVVEEIVKFLPWVVVLGLMKSKDEPFDYILFACMSALGFAFAENIFYFSDAGLDNIHSRALITVTSHMFDASLVAYFMILFRFKLKKNPWIGACAGLLLASLAHGFYDFWLIHQFDEDWTMITIIFFLVTMHFWFTMMNNAINNSPNFDLNLRIDNSRISFFLSGSLTGILVVEYIVLGLSYGIDYANATFTAELFAGGYFIFYLASNLSNMDLIKGYWAPINFPLGSFIAAGSLPMNYLDYRVKIYTLTQKGALEKYFPMNGVVINRAIISKNPNWFVLRLDEPLRFKGFHKGHVILFFPDQPETLESREPLLTNVYLIKEESDFMSSKMGKDEIKRADRAKTRYVGEEAPEV